MDRRTFLRAAAVTGASATLPVARAQLLFSRLGRSRSAPRVEIALAADSVAMWQGAEMSVVESARSAAMFGGTITLVRAADAASRASGAIRVLLGGRTITDARALAAAALESDQLFINVGCDADALRADCSRNTFHVAPSARMKGAAAGEVNGSDDARAWLPSLQRFGADTLNKRFMARYGTPMTSDVWTSWCAVKCVWDAALRANASEGRAIVAYLERDGSRFDAHKGTPLFFDGQHQLVQPLYVVGKTASGDAVVREWTEPASASAACEWTAR
jgi:hypothetical protein